MLKNLIKCLLIMTALTCVATAGPNRFGPRTLALTPQKTNVEQSGSKEQEEIIRAIIDCHKLMGEKNYDLAMAAAYRALNLSRQAKDVVLEIEALQLLATIDTRLGNEFVAAKLHQDRMVKFFAALRTYGYVGWYKKATATNIDCLNFDERYLFYSLKSDMPFGGLTELVDKIRERLKADSDDEVSEDNRKVLTFFAGQLEQLNEKLMKAIGEEKAADFKRAAFELCDLFEKVVGMTLKSASEEDREELKMAQSSMKHFKNYMKAYVAKDKARAFAEIDNWFKVFDEAMKRDDGINFENAAKEALDDIETELDTEGAEILQHLLRASSQRSSLNVYLLHFMKADKSVEPVLKRYGYVTLGDLAPYQGAILAAADELREQLKTSDQAAFPDVLPTPDYGLSENSIALNSAFTPEGRWLYNGNAAFLLTARDEILELMERTRELQRRTRINPDYAMGNLFLRKGVVAYDEGNSREAIASLQQAAGIFQKTRDSELLWQTYLMIGLVHKKDGNIAQAISFLKDSIVIIERMRASFRAENIRALVVEDRIAVYELLIELLSESNQGVEALAYVEKTKARILLDRFQDPRMKVIPGVKPSTADAVRNTLRRLQDNQKARNEGRTIASLEAEELNEKIATEDKKYQRALEELRYSNREYASIISGDIVPIAAVQKLLSDDMVMLEYYVGARKTLIFVCSKSGLAVVTSNASYRELEPQIREFRNRIEVGADNYQPLATQLYSTLIAPVESQIQGKRLCVVPHGASHFLPFHALMKGDRYLIEDHEVFYASSSSVLKYAFEKRKLSTDKILIVGDPAGNLRLAQEEAQSVAGVFNSPKLLLGNDATKTRVMEALSGVDIIHFATHAMLNKENPLLSELRLSNGTSLSVVDIYGVEINASLVTLSACQTNLGKLTNGDEVIGLTRAFIFSGVPSLVTSLWETRDDSTSRLMVAFYRALRQQGTTKSGALRQAQIGMIRTSGAFSHPRNWAQFILIGDYR